MSLAIYDIAFDEAGLYTAYYLARGFASNSDSFFSPDKFELALTTQVNTSSDGVFDWMKGDEYNISESSVDVPLEFRLGAREKFAQINAFLFTWMEIFPMPNSTHCLPPQS